MRQEQKSARNGHSAGVGDLRATIQGVAGIFVSFNSFYLTSHAWMDETELVHLGLLGTGRDQSCSAGIQNGPG